MPGRQVDLARRQDSPERVRPQRRMSPGWEVPAHHVGGQNPELIWLPRVVRVCLCPQVLMHVHTAPRETSACSLLSSVSWLPIK